MEVGRYVDGRPITYDQSQVAFAIGGTPVTFDMMRAYEGAGQVAWSSGEMRDWGHGLLATSAPPPPTTKGRGAYQNLLSGVGGVLVGIGLALKADSWLWFIFSCTIALLGGVVIIGWFMQRRQE